MVSNYKMILNFSTRIFSELAIPVVSSSLASHFMRFIYLLMNASAKTYALAVASASVYTDITSIFSVVLLVWLADGSLLYEKSHNHAYRE